MRSCGGGTSNIQHPTPNIEQAARQCPIGSWMLDVQCWMFCRVGSGYSAINAPRRAGLCDHDLTQRWQRRLQSFPDPQGDVFAGRVFQAGNFVKVTMVELFPKRLEGFGNVGVIHQPAEFWVAFARDDNLGLETVAVQTAALVRLGQVRQQMRRLKLKS